MGGGRSIIQKPISVNRLFKCIATDNIDLFKETYDIVINLDGKERVINYKDDDAHHRTPLMIACIAGYTDIVSLLINCGASINDVDDEGHTSLMLACDKGHTECVRLLLEAGADIDRLVAIIIIIIIIIITIIIIYRQTSSTGETALIIATNNNHVDVVRLLVNASANTTLCTSSGGNTAFTIAIWNGYLECAKLLYKEDIINVKNVDGKYPLMQACSQGHHECVQWLRKIGADVNAINDDGYSAIFYASHHDKVNCVEALIKGKGKADINLKNKFGNTCLYKAIEKGYLKVIQTLINAGADVNNKNNHGITPIMQSAWSGKLDTLK